MKRVRNLIGLSAALTALALSLTACPSSIENSGVKTPAITPDDYVMSKGADGDLPAWSKGDLTYSIPDLKLHGEGTNITQELKSALADAKTKTDFFKAPKNYILMIGDGMGVSQIVAASKFRGDLIMNELPYRAVANSFVRGNDSMSGEVTDSGQGGTKIATGYRTEKLFVSMDGEGNELLSLSELARSKGKKIGVVTNAGLPDATPSDFTVHSKHRSQGWNKLCQMQVLFGADLFMGGTDSSLVNATGSLKPLSGKKIKMYSKYSDMINALDSSDLMWPMFKNGDVKYGRWDYNNKNAPSLQQQMAFALTRLQRTSGDEGFFLMFENTYTDIYGHYNENDFRPTTKESTNVCGIVNEVKDFDEAVAIALKFVLENPDTVLLITADHETGNMKFKSDWESRPLEDERVKAESGNHSNQNVPVFAIGYGLNELDQKKGEPFTTADCTLVGGNVIDNTRCGQILGDILNGENNSFGGNIESDRRGRTKDTFKITVKENAEKVTFTLTEKTLPIYRNELIQFKIKPFSENAKITLKDSAGNILMDGLEFLSNRNNALVADSSGNITTVLSKAYKHAFNSKTDEMDGWYQVSVKAMADNGNYIFEFENNGNEIAAGSEILLYDLTVQYASTKGYVSITDENVEVSSFEID